MSPRRLALSALASAGLLVPLAALRAEEIEAVSSRVAADYVRQTSPDGGFLPETYAFGPGGHWAGGDRDPSIEKIAFLDVAHVIAEPLASQHYVPSRDPGTTKLLIMVYWGTTNPPSRQSGSVAYQNAASAMNALQLAKNTPIPPPAAGQARGQSASKSSAIEEENAASAAIALLQADNAQRRRRDIETSQLLGYDSWWADTARLEGTPLDVRRQDLLNELEDSRYFVVLMAYDFQLMWKEKKNKLLWETRFSVSERHHRFDEVLPAMARFAAKYFGQDSHGLQHHEVPLGKVELGELKSLGEPASPPDAPASAGK